MIKMNDYGNAAYSIKRFNVIVNRMGFRDISETHFYVISNFTSYLVFCDSLH